MSTPKSRSRRKLPKEGSSSHPPSSHSLDASFRDFEGSRIELYLYKFFYFVRENTRQFALAFFALLTLFLCGLGYTAWLEHRESQSLISFRKLMKEPPMNIQSGSPEIALEKLTEYGKEHRHRKARLRGMLYQLQYLEKEKKFRTMAQLCIKIGDELESPELRASFYLRGALHAENLGLYEKAEKAYRLAAKNIHKKNELKAKALLGQSRMLGVLGKKKDARKALKEILAFAEEKDHRSEKYLSYAALYLLELE